jgi:hypothetical protein
MPATSLSAPSPSGSRPTGSRRLSLHMLSARDSADRFTGLPAGTAKPFRFLAAFQEAEPYLNLPALAYKIADRDPRWQADVVIGPAGAGDRPNQNIWSVHLGLPA